MKVYLDFDGTVVEHSFPSLGRYNPGAFQLIKLLQDSGHEVILNTYRSEISPESLEQALGFVNNFSWRYLELEQEIEPITTTKEKIEPWNWDLEDAIKHDTLFIDDISYGVPLIPAKMVNNMMVDLFTVINQLKEKGIIK